MEITKVEGLELGDKIDVELLQGKTAPADPKRGLFPAILDDGGLGGMRAKVNGKALRLLTMSWSPVPWLDEGEFDAKFIDEESGKTYTVIYKPEMKGRIVTKPKASFEQK